MIKWFFPLDPHSLKTNGGQCRSSESTSSLQTSSGNIPFVSFPDHKGTSPTPDGGAFFGVWSICALKIHDGVALDKCLGKRIVGFIK
ncbi:hypothetical protein TNCT_514531 [Trichonephila clavata]|uniref:Uncharacterized protein n=1 Tax=Trichonephila clavata TaxID=2740835 RepID=A0A8X6L6G7_TRICU|nr:hypothetical protein TNCT_514531 [Trichonephila clavata]